MQACRLSSCQAVAPPGSPHRTEKTAGRLQAARPHHHHHHLRRLRGQRKQLPPRVPLLEVRLEVIPAHSSAQQRGPMERAARQQAASSLQPGCGAAQPRSSRHAPGAPLRGAGQQAAGAHRYSTSSAP
jgi:hypothetical protein